MPYAHPSGFPPRSPDLRENCTPAKAVSPTEARRGTGPRPTVKGGAAFFIVARGPSDAIRASERVSPAISIVMMCVSPSVVCDRLITNGSGSGDPDLQGLARERWRGTGPRPTMKGGRFYRSAGACPPRPLDCADDDEGQVFPPPYDEGGLSAALLHRDQEVSPTGETESFAVSRNHSNPASTN